MKIKRIFYFLLFITWFIPCNTHSQTNDIGGIGSISFSKEFSRSLDMSFEQELRLNKNFSSFDRTMSSLGLDYTLIRKLLKAELNYDLIYQNQVSYFEFRQRASAALAFQRKTHRFEFKLKTKGQMSWRDQDYGDFSYNPKYLWRNKLECAYDIFGSPIKPYISAEIFCPINGKKGFYMDSYRAVLGAKYKTSSRTSFNFMLRFDQEIQQSNPKTMLYGGIGWNYDL